MRRRPFLLFLASLLFLYFPLEFIYRHQVLLHPFSWIDFLLSCVFPGILIVGLIRVTKIGWYTLVTLIALWGVRDLWDYAQSERHSIQFLVSHLLVYAISLSYFINPRIRPLYFDPKMRWWRSKPRYETHLPIILKEQGKAEYPILRNLSEGGCFIETAHLFAENTKLQVEIPFPIEVPVPFLRTWGIVKWASTNPLRHGMGIEFEPLNAIEKKSILKFVDTV